MTVEIGKLRDQLCFYIEDKLWDSAKEMESASVREQKAKQPLATTQARKKNAAASKQGASRKQASKPVQSDDDDSDHDEYAAAKQASSRKQASHTGKTGRKKRSKPVRSDDDDIDDDTDDGEPLAAPNVVPLSTGQGVAAKFPANSNSAIQLLGMQNRAAAEMVGKSPAIQCVAPSAQRNATVLQNVGVSTQHFGMDHRRNPVVIQNLGESVQYFSDDKENLTPIQRAKFNRKKRKKEVEESATEAVKQSALWVANARQAFSRPEKNTAVRKTALDLSNVCLRELGVRPTVYDAKYISAKTRKAIGNCNSRCNDRIKKFVEKMKMDASRLDREDTWSFSCLCGGADHHLHTLLMPSGEIVGSAFGLGVHELQWITAEHFMSFMTRAAYFAFEPKNDRRCWAVNQARFIVLFVIIILVSNLFYV